MISDMEAWTLAIEMARAADPRRREQLDSMLAKGRPFAEVGKLAAYGCQFRSLHARPWATVPCSLLEDVDVVLARGDDGDPHGDYVAAVLLAKMRAAGISRWHPDPERALREAEKKPAA
jgi:hypothetical protein